MTSSKKFLLFAFLLLVVDQATKLAVKGFSIFGMTYHGMYLGQSIPVLGDFLRLTYVENPGMAFGIGFGAGKIFLTLFSLLASVGLTWYLLRIRTSSFWLRFGLALVLAGATGNLIDRLLYGVLYGDAPLFYGRVVDFIDFEFFDFSFFGHTFSRWPVFNIADACVTCGMVMLLLSHKHLPVEDTSEQRENTLPDTQPANPGPVHSDGESYPARTEE